MSRPAVPRGAIPTSNLFVVLLSIRLLNSLTLRTFFQPDEFFQSLEPAWNISFGHSAGGWITWEWKEKLRSIAHPMIFAWTYKSADWLMNNVFYLDKEGALRGEMLVALPRVVMAVFASIGDIYTMKFVGKVLGVEGGWDALFLSLGSAFHWFCSTRTLSNSLETSITAIALHYWPWSLGPNGKKLQDWERGFIYSLLLAAIASILRPTNALIWGCLGIMLLFRSTQKERAFIILEVVKIGAIILTLNATLDYSYYKELVFPQYTFLKFNLVRSLSIFYGKMPWHYYLSQGLPLLLTCYLPLTIPEAVTTLKTSFDIFLMPKDRKEKQSPSQAPTRDLLTRLELTITTLIVLTTYSFIAHKEVRFIYPLLPIFLLLAASFCQNTTLLSSRHSKKTLIFSLLAINTPVCFYATQIHQSGVISVTHYLRATRSQWNTLGFLMPCHSTPWQSHLQLSSHNAWALTCEPPLHLCQGTNETLTSTSYLDEADLFYDNPRKFLESFLPSTIPDTRYRTGANPKKRTWEETKHDRWPDRLVFFGELEERALRDYLKERGGLLVTNSDGHDGDRQRTGYRPCARFFNTHWHDDWRRRGDVVVYCLHQ